MNRVILCQPMSHVVKTGQAYAGDFAVLDGNQTEAIVLETFQRFKLVTFVPMVFEYRYKGGRFQGATRVLPTAGMNPFKLDDVEYCYRYHTLSWLPRRREFVEYVSFRHVVTVSMLGIRAVRSRGPNAFWEPVAENLTLPIPATVSAAVSEAISQLPPHAERTLPPRRKNLFEHQWHSLNSWGNWNEQ